MPNKLKREKVFSYQSLLTKSPHFALIGFERVSHQKMEEIRKGLRPLKKQGTGTDFKVIKNSLLAVALRKNKLDSLVKTDSYKGQTAMLLLGGDWSESLALYYKLAKKEDGFFFRCGVLDGKYYDKDELESIAKLPPKTELISMIIRSLRNSHTRVVFSINYPITRLMQVIKQIKSS